ncbi:MAG: hypothetical protein Q8M11_18770 [Sulfuritalea sp.]|jgi:hypothetical protein|nr:hypothetical protein [Sulfuritalea sp.]MDP1983435.1 hypothetical protein [Sulfuritalea sp.]
MKTPHGFVYAILITVAIVAVTLFARSQSSPIIATPTVHIPPPESAADAASADSKEESGGKEANPKPDDDASK